MSILSAAMQDVSSQLPAIPLPLNEAVTFTVDGEVYEIPARDPNDRTKTTDKMVPVVDVNSGKDTFTVYLQTGIVTALARANRKAGLPLDTLPVGSQHTLTFTGKGLAQQGRNAPNLYTWAIGPNKHSK